MEKKSFQNFEFFQKWVEKDLVNFGKMFSTSQDYGKNNVKMKT